MDTYTIEPILERRNEDVESLLRDVRAALLAVEAIVRGAKTPIPTVNLDDDGNGHETNGTPLPSVSH